MDRFDAMSAFARVVETGSFTRAAETLNVNKTTVTQLVQQLEARLRVKLLNRTTRQVNVTADGAAYYERVVRLLGDLEEADASVSSAQASPKGRLRVDVFSGLGRRVLLPQLPEFHARFPEIQIDVGLSDRAIDLIGDNVDCVIRGGPVTDQSLIARRIGEFEFMLCASPSYLDRMGLPEHPQALTGGEHRTVGYFSALTGRQQPYVMHRGSETVEVLGRYDVAVNDFEGVLVAGLAGMGVFLVVRGMAAPHIERGELRPVLEDWHFHPLPIHVAFPPNRHVSAKLRVFIDWTVEQMAVHAPLAPAHQRRVG